MDDKIEDINTRLDNMEQEIKWLSEIIDILKENIKNIKNER
jgi:hypothetical protein